MLSRLFFGEDVFISYSRRDGADYALGLADELTRRGFSCFLDQLGTEPGARLPASLKSRLRDSTVLVLVGSPAALNSEAVAQEVEEFKKTGRPIIPVYFEEGAAPRDSLVYRHVAGVALTGEMVGALASGRPSEEVVSRVEKSFNYTRRNARLRRVVWATVLGVALLLGAAAVVSAALVRGARRQADALVTAAREQKEAAEDAMRAAQARADEAEELMRRAEQQRREAQALAEHAAAVAAAARAGRR